MSLRDYLSNGIPPRRLVRSPKEIATKPEAARGDDDLMSSDPNEVTTVSAAKPTSVRTSTAPDPAETLRTV